MLPLENRSVRHTVVSLRRIEDPENRMTTAAAWRLHHRWQDVIEVTVWEIMATDQTGTGCSIDAEKYLKNQLCHTMINFVINIMRTHIVVMPKDDMNDMLK